MTTIDRDLGYKKFVKEYSQADGAHVKLGFQGPKADAPKASPESEFLVKLSERLTVLQVAVYHEFGGSGGRPPERSFLRSTHDRTITERTNFAAKLLDKIALGKIGLNQALGLMGLKGVALIKETIRKSIGIKPLADSTLAARIAKFGKRGRNPTPLVDTGQMINSLTFVKVVQGDAAEPQGGAD